MVKDHDSEEAQAADSTRMPAWKKLLLVLAGCFVIAGIALRFSGTSDAQPVDGSGDLSSGEKPRDGATEYSGNFLPDGSQLPDADGADGSAGSPAASWSPFFLQGGFGFFLGFSIGLVLRTAFKIAAFGAGIIFLILFGLQYAGVDVPWDSIRDAYDGLAGRVAANADGFMEFLQGMVPATVFSGAGLVAGFKRS
ncbi:MAG: putative membrane protein (Fun14 family) [Planctomycetota bacterium]|jgi:uncharacterized membrane protein (Fun14 family)